MGLLSQRSDSGDVDKGTFSTVMMVNAGEESVSLTSQPSEGNVSPNGS